MPETIGTTVYRLHKLSKAAKEKAHAWQCESGFDEETNRLDPQDLFQKPPVLSDCD